MTIVIPVIVDVMPQSEARSRRRGLGQLDLIVARQLLHRREGESRQDLAKAAVDLVPEQRGGELRVKGAQRGFDAAARIGFDDRRIEHRRAAGGSGHDTATETPDHIAVGECQPRGFRQRHVQRLLVAAGSAWCAAARSQPLRKPSWSRRRGTRSAWQWPRADRSDVRGSETPGGGTSILPCSAAVRSVRWQGSGGSSSRAGPAFPAGRIQTAACGTARRPQNQCNRIYCYRRHFTYHWSDSYYSAQPCRSLARESG